MRNYYMPIFILLLLVSSIICKAEVTDTIRKPDTCRVGIYLKAIYDFNSRAYSYDVDFWMWFLYKNDSLKPYQTAEIANAKKYTYSNESVIKKISPKLNWATVNCKATINQNWDLTHYPFDKQKLEIVVEESELDRRKLLLIREEPKFEYNKDIDIKGWNVDSIRVRNGFTHYTSDFGDPTINNGQSDYCKVLYTIYLSRNSWALFFKLFTGCYVAFLVAFLVFFIRPIYVDPRFGLSIGGLFAAVGNKYVVDTNIPESIDLTLVDKVHDITFVFILVTLLISVVSLKLHSTKGEQASKLLDKKSSIIILSLYLIINVGMICYSSFAN